MLQQNRSFRVVLRTKVLRSNKIKLNRSFFCEKLFYWIRITARKSCNAHAPMLYSFFFNTFRKPMKMNLISAYKNFDSITTFPSNLQISNVKHDFT